mmetsp:Transcript_10801/g.15431  ORF Transcript_10801/g.15431 Transcript_10801/m.15431 type:complete len:261 (-) Transcript_10801:40-822(-)
MADELEEEGIRFREENDLIQTKINEESGKLAKLEEELEKTTGKFDKKRNDWDHKLLEVERVGRLKARQMNNRCEAIRKEMNKLIESTKRQGEKEHTSIVRQYEKKISAVDSTILELKQALVLSSQETLQFENRLETVTRQRDSANLENYVTEHRYIQAIASRNKEISSLKRDTLDLEHNKEEREGKIQRYESSYQELAKLTVKLARKRMAKKSPRKWITAVCRRRGSASGQKKNTADFLSSIASSSPSSTLLDELDKIEP